MLAYMHLGTVVITLSICVILPIVICWIVFSARRNYDNKNAAIIMRAIETNSSIDADKLINALAKPHKSPEQVRHSYLLRGCIGAFLGLAATVIILVCSTMYGYNTHDAVFLMFFAGLCLSIGIPYLIVYYISGKSAKNNKE